MSGDWSHSIFGCMSSCSTCLVTCICPCYTFGSNIEKLEGTNKYLCCCAYILAESVYLGFCLGCYFRGKIRESRGIEGGLLGDCICHFFCPCCALCQEAREVDQPAVTYGGGGVVTDQPA